MRLGFGAGVIAGIAGTIIWQKVVRPKMKGA